jgi:hypothetical protein
MSNRGVSTVWLSLACTVAIVPCARAMTLDYRTAAGALVEVSWWDTDWGNMVVEPIQDSEESDNDPSRAHAYWTRQGSISRMDIGAVASVKSEPNRIVLTGEISASHTLGGDWRDFNYFYQDSGCYAEGFVQIDDLPAAMPCSVHFEATWPQDTWTGAYYWRFEAVSEIDGVQCGWDEQGPYGPRSGSVTAFVGEPVYIYLATRAGGYAEPDGPFNLGSGLIQLDLVLTTTRHVADLKADAIINFEDFAIMAHQWRRTDADPAQAVEGTPADFNSSGVVDMNDLEYFAYWWLLSPRPETGDDGPAQ